MSEETNSQDTEVQAPAEEEYKEQKEEPIIRIGGVDWGGWTSFQFSQQIDAICPEFAFGLCDRWTVGQEALPIAAGMECEVFLRSVKGQMSCIMQGYIDAVGFSIGPSLHNINISGRGRQADLVDCSAMNRPGSWKNLLGSKIVKELALPFGINTYIDTGIDQGAPVEHFKLEEGETAFEAMDRILKQKEYILMPYVVKGESHIVIGRVGQIKLEDRLVQGENILEASASYDVSDRYSDYIVKGQMRGSDETYGTACSQVRGEAVDESVERYRPLLVRAENQVDLATAEKRAKWEASVRAARSVTVTCKIRGWRNKSGYLWNTNLLVATQIPYLRIDQDLLISKVTFNMTREGGTITTLELKDPKAFEPEPPKKVKGASAGSGKSAGPELQQASSKAAWTAYNEMTSEKPKD